MAGRQGKIGIDYFPMDVHNDDKLKLLIAEFGMKGFGVVISLFQRIYAEEGYYTVLNETVLKLFAHEKNAGDFSVVDEIIKGAVRIGIFDKEMYEKYSILTSRGIQKRYQSVTSRRLGNNIKDQYFLLNAPDIDNDANINSISAYINSKIVNSNEQSKVKQSKVKQSIKRIGEIEKLFEVFYSSYPKKAAKAAALKAFSKLEPDDGLLKIMLDSLEKQKKIWKDPQFIPHPSTWINQRRWEDEVNAKNQSRTYTTGQDRFGNRVY